MSYHALKKPKEVLIFAGVRNPVDVTAHLVKEIDLLETNMDVLFGDGVIILARHSPVTWPRWPRVLPITNH